MFEKRPIANGRMKLNFLFAHGQLLKLACQDSIYAGEHDEGMKCGEALQPRAEISLEC
jgi:hypothetical protein